MRKPDVSVTLDRDFDRKLIETVVGAGYRLQAPEAEGREVGVPA